MHALVRAAITSACLAAIASAAQLRSGLRTVVVDTIVRPAAVDELSSVCPAGLLPDRDQCVPIPDEPGDQAALRSRTNAHRDKAGLWRVYEQIPRRPDRPADYERYRYPVAFTDTGTFVLSGYDLDLPDTDQRRGPGLSHVGHGGIDLDQARGTEVRLVPLENQQGPAEVVFVGRLFGNTVATRHTVLEGGHARDYLVLYGHLDSAAPGLVPNRTVSEGELLGFVGDSGSDGIVHLHLEVRQVRDGVDASLLRDSSLAQPTVSIPCDPRNVLPLK